MSITILLKPRLIVWLIVCMVISSCTVFDNKLGASPEEKVLKQSIEKNPNDAQAYYRLGLFYFSESRYDSAIDFLEKSIKIKPSYAEAYYALGLSQLRTKKQQLAIENFQKAIELKPDYWSEAYNQIGAIYRELGDKASIERSLIIFKSASEKCTDANNSLCLAIIQNIVVTYIDLYRMSHEDKKKELHLKNAIELAELTLTSLNEGINVHQYAMLLNTLGDAYVMKGGQDNLIKAKAVYNKALSLLDKNTYVVEHGMIQNSLDKLKQDANDKRVVEREINDQVGSGGDLLFKFVDINGRPLNNAFISLHEKRDDEYIKAHFRDEPIDNNGTISLSSTILQLPKGSELFVRTADGFYWYSTKIANLKAYNGYVKIVVPQTGIISATISGYPKNIEQPLIVLIYKLNEKSTYEEFYGMGIGLSIGYTFRIHGLPTGTYKMRIKKDYEDSRVLYERDAIKIDSGKVTNISGIELN